MKYSIINNKVCILLLTKPECKFDTAVFEEERKSEEINV